MPELTLPPLDDQCKALLKGIEDSPFDGSYKDQLSVAIVKLECRERQLLAVTTERDHALKELAKQDAGMGIQKGATENE